MLFHAALADHHDLPSCTDGAHSPVHLHKKNPSCHFDDLVVSIPFFSHNAAVTFSQGVGFQEKLISPLPFHFQLSPASTESRGPPRG